MLTIISWVVAALIAGLVLYYGYFALLTLRIAASAERKVAPAGKFVDIDGNRIHYVEAGKGRPILFIHGLGAQLHQFRHPLFARFEKDYRIVALDRPGSGYSVRASGAGAGISEQARLIVAFMDRLGLENRCWSAIRSAASSRWQSRSSIRARRPGWHCFPPTRVTARRSARNSRRCRSESLGAAGWLRTRQPFRTP